MKRLLLIVMVVSGTAVFGAATEWPTDIAGFSALVRSTPYDLETYRRLANFADARASELKSAAYVIEPRLKHGKLSVTAMEDFEAQTRVRAIFAQVLEWETFIVNLKVVMDNKSPPGPPGETSCGHYTGNRVARGPRPPGINPTRGLSLPFR